MCDTIRQRNIPKADIPEYVYKVCLKDSEGNYYTGIMLQPIKLGVWNQAPKRNPDKYRNYNYLAERLASSRPNQKNWIVLHGSSSFRRHHNGRWGSFENKRDAKFVFDRLCVTTDSGEKLKRVILKCKIGGVVDSSNFGLCLTYLSSSIFPIEEI